jgi:hypothetical protein
MGPWSCPGLTFLLEREDEEHTLLRRIDDLAMTGLARTKLWSSDTGAERLNLFRDL